MKKFHFHKTSGQIKIRLSTVINYLFLYKLPNIEQRKKAKEINVQRNPKYFPKINASEK